MNFAEQLKQQVNIVDVIGQYVRLKRSGSGHRYVGLCPFHSEKTPSFYVHGVDQFYKCFGCDAKGDVFSFIQQIETLTFPEALKSLAERYGIPIPQRSAADDPAAQRRNALFEMHEIAASLFQANLRGPGGTEARRYLESRGVSAAAVDEFRLGLSDAFGQQLADRLKKFGPDLLEASGLAGKRQDGSGYFDRFRARLMFPIHDESGKVIAFGGRALRPGDEPKYLNSPETKIYRKSTVLYNMHRAKIDARKHDRMILVEGYMDVIGVYSAGIREVVASCGTALGSDQVRSIKRQTAQQSAGTGQVILNFDPDAAGARSAEKYISHFLAEGLRVRVVELPGDLDPDAFIQQQGADAYRRCLNTATPYFQWLTIRARQKFDCSTIEGRVDAFKWLLPAIRHVQDRVERAEITKEISANLNLERDLVVEHLRHTSKRQEVSRHSVKLSSAFPPNEVLLLTCLLRSESARLAIKHFLSGTGVLHLLELRPVFEAALAMEREDVAFSPPALSARLEPRLQSLVTELSFAELTLEEEDAAQQALHCLRALEAKVITSKHQDVKKKIRELENAGKLEEAMALMEELGRPEAAVSRS
jgi:DNA primase